MDLSGDRFLDQQPASGAAHLPLIEPDGIDQTFDSTVEISVLEDDEGTLATQFESESFPSTGGCLANDPADLGRAGERDLVDICMRNDGSAGFTIPGDDVEDSGR